MNSFLQLEFPALAAGALAAMSCAIVGCFLVLRRMSLMGDAISHAVLPGIVAAFVFTHSLGALPVFIGCAIVGMLTAMLSDLIHRLARVEPGASMGVVFTVLFAAGVVWLSQVEAHGGRGVHLDAGCVLYGAMEGVIWPGAPALEHFPRQVSTLAIVLIVDALFLLLLFKELRISAFDPALAAAQGIPPGLMHYLLMMVVAMTTVAAFEAVGSILVVAMLIVPALVAHLLTDRLAVLVPLSALAALIAAVLGYVVAATWPVNAAGMIGVMLGAMLLITGLIAPRHGWIARLARRVAMAVSIRAEDMLGALYRSEESGPVGAWTTADLVTAVGGGWRGRFAYATLRRRGQVVLADGVVQLTDPGRAAASNLVRSHRLWEAWLVQRLGLRPDHVHGTAMRLEHLTGHELQQALASGVKDTGKDPHGRQIPDP